MRTMNGQWRARRPFVMRTRIALLLLHAALASACSIDVSKLRAPSALSPDGGHPDATGSGAPVVDGGLAAPPDLVPASEAAAPWDLQPSPDRETWNPDGGGADAGSDVATAVGIDAVGPDGDGTLDAPGVGPDGDGTLDATGAGPDGDGTLDATGVGPDSGMEDTNGDSPAADDAGVDAPDDLGPLPPVPDPDLVLWYKFDESTGTTAADSALWNGVARNATLATFGTGQGASATFTSASQVGSHAVSLTPSTSTFNAGGGYVSLPSLQSLAPDAMTIAAWVNIPTNTTAQTWARVFDFGTGTSVYMYLTVRAQDSTNAPVRFSITRSGYSNEQHIDGLPALGAGAWHHIAIVLQAGSTYTGTMYIDGTAVGTNNRMTVHASDLGATTNNWLGRSQWSGSAGSNPFLNGALDDFRVYRRALSQQEIVALIAVQ